MNLEFSALVLIRSRCLWPRKSRARAQRMVVSGFCESAPSFFLSTELQRAPTRAEASPPLVSSCHQIDLRAKAADAAQNETHDWYLDAGRLFCNQSQRYHRYAVKPAG